MENTDLSIEHLEALRALADALGARGLADESAAVRADVGERMRAKGLPARD